MAHRLIPMASASVKLPIERGLPIPRLSLYPFRAMQVGDSFFAPTQRHALQRNAYNHGRRLGYRFTSRLVTEKGVKGPRIWRVA